ncbi:hypothetical protein PLESTB_000026900 [Pleodorina starrii]|uniref:RZ-type domain-containing protein n=1 Tax=Pleodorina starrii TaxID=330485 RepID=A0A9W6B8D2_9CHLO|nr:hypothetical protein PLESTM_001107700 [Pleodorina starrii]GLC47799.1 hypothetical protein PLESTB_000026900 [Pleodorina starrii]
MTHGSARVARQQVTLREQREVLMAVAVAECCGRDPVAWLSSHVFMCPNGHAYFVGECGCPTQAGSCYECGAQVGGSGHLLGAGNSLARELVARVQAEAGVR